MTLLQRIKSEQLQARKSKDSTATSLLTTLLGDVAMVGKNDGNRDPTDEEVIKVIKKFVTNATETKNQLTAKDHVIGMATSEVRDSMQAVLVIGKELDILNSLLPEQLNEFELNRVITGIISTLGAISLKDMGKIMKALKEQHAGTYDGAMANALVKKAFGA